MKNTHLVLLLFIGGCVQSDHPCNGERSDAEISAVLSCSASKVSRCRVELNDGRRATMKAPVVKGDKVVTKGRCIWPSGIDYMLINAGSVSGN